MATYINKNGTDNSDVLTYDSSASSTVVYHAGKGNDTITVAGGKVTVYTDGGNNTVTLSGGSGHVIQVAPTVAEGDKVNGKEVLFINNADQVDAILGSGSDDVIICKSNGKKSTGALSQIRGGLWNDSFSTYAGTENYQLYGDAGNDAFTISGGSNIVCWGGAANDTFNVTGGTGIKLRGGDSADIYNLSGNANAVDMQLGYGNDIVVVSAGDKHTIKANLGINEINLLAGSDHVITADIDQAASKKKGYSDAMISAGKGVGYGVDKVFVNGAQKVTANLGDGKDYVELSNTEGSKIYTEGWADAVVVNSGAVGCTVETGLGDDELIVNGGEGNNYRMGTGNDMVMVDGGVQNTINTEEGNDVLYLKSAADSTFRVGEGDDLVIVDGMKGTYRNRNYVVLDHGNDTLIIKDAEYLSTYAYSGDKNIKVEGGTNLSIESGSGDDKVLVTGGLKSTVSTLDGSDSIYIENLQSGDGLDMRLFMDREEQARDYLWIDWDNFRGKVIVFNDIWKDGNKEPEKQDKIMLTGLTNPLNAGSPINATYNTSQETLSLYSGNRQVDLLFRGGQFVSEIYLQDLSGFVNNTCTVVKVKDIIDKFTNTSDRLSLVDNTEAVVQDDPFKFKSVNDAFNIFSAYE